MQPIFYEFRLIGSGIPFQTGVPDLQKIVFKDRRPWDSVPNPVNFWKSSTKAFLLSSDRIVYCSQKKEAFANRVQGRIFLQGLGQCPKEFEVKIYE